MVYLGYHRSARDMVRAAVQEDVRAIGISSYNGGHVEFFTEVVKLLRLQGADDIGVFGGGGGTISPDDAAAMRKNGVDRIFFAGTPLTEMLEWVQSTYGPPRERGGHRNGKHAVPPDRRIAKLLTAAESAADGIDATSDGAASPAARHRRDRPRRRGEDDADRRTGPPLPPLRPGSCASPSSRTTRASSATARCSATGRR